MGHVGSHNEASFVVSFATAGMCRQRLEYSKPCFALCYFINARMTPWSVVYQGAHVDVTVGVLSMLRRCWGIVGAPKVFCCAKHFVQLLCEPALLWAQVALSLQEVGWRSFNSVLHHGVVAA